VRAIKAGANGDLTKESAPFQLLHALRRIASGGAFISAEVAEQLALGAMPGGVSATHEALSDREFEVFSLIVAGNSVTNIAARLNLSVKTISTHKTNLMHKMGLKNQSELIRYAIKNEVGDALDL
jgi:DNA-binding NarL/FixJ family response regulator